MSIQPVVKLLGFLLAAGFAVAQQTGTIVGTVPAPAEGQRPPIAVAVPPAKPTCDARTQANGGVALPAMVFSRMVDYLVCLRHPDGNSEKLLNAGPWMKLSADGQNLAYWIPARHELRVFTIANRSDTFVDTLPGATMREIAWSGNGRALAYAFQNAIPSGIRVFDLNTGKRNLINTSFSGLGASRDPDHIMVVTWEGVQRIRIADGSRETLAAIQDASEAAYSPSGALLGVLISQPSASAAEASDNEPDCTGGTFALVVQKTGTQQLVKVPFPQGFDNVLDFAFSPDDRAIAVTFGAAACDYPGEVARVYRVSLPDLALAPVSPADRLSVKAQWSPDSKIIVYSDYTGSDSPLVALDVQTGAATSLTNPKQDGPDEFLGWAASRP